MRPSSALPDEVGPGSTGKRGREWYLTRVRAMSAREIVTRVRRVLLRASWRVLRHLPAPAPGPEARDPWRFPAEPGSPPPGSEALIAEAEAYLEGRFRWAGVPCVEPVPAWHRDPETGREAPTGFAYSIDVRDPTVVGNIKAVWERSQHQAESVLALAYRLTGREAFAALTESRLRSWVRANPVLTGVNWSSPLELAIRLISWVWVERLLRDTPYHAPLFGPAGCMWRPIYWHQRVLAGDFSHGSSANDHLIGEMAGLYISATVWPRFQRSKSWRREARSKLEVEAICQTFPSGLDREQAFGYHLYVCGFLLLAGLEAERGGRPFGEEYRERVQAMLDAIVRLRDAGGHLPRWGDSDDSVPLRLHGRGPELADWLLELGEKWPGFTIGDRRAAAPALPTAVIDPPLGRGESRASRANGSEAFTDAGVYVLTSRRGALDELLCQVDAGPLGYLSLAAHAHADALSLTLNVAGRPILVDPGTFAYHSRLEWRRYFRGTSAHNTIVVDGEDQSLPGGPFLWLRHARCQVHEWTVRREGGLLTASHDGYERLDDPVRHRRTVRLDDRRLHVTDRLEGRGEHDVAARWHFAPECRVTSSDDRVLVRRDRVEVELVPDPSCEWSVDVGGQEGGWYSPRFGELVSAPTLTGGARVRLPFEMETRLEVRVGESPAGAPGRGETP